VVPCMLGSSDGIEALLEALEVRYLGNRDPQVHFGLLTDLRDADTEQRDEDAAMLAQAEAGIRALNIRYPVSACDHFFLFHRPRLWNVAEHCWMGHERKRGKLTDLNAVLRGAGWGSFDRIVGNVSVLSDVRYVITLDTDTQLPRDAARELVGTMAHPLNQPRLDAGGQRVCAGYGILQPRMAASVSGTGRSRYARLFGSEPGIDPYTRSVSDVYHDLLEGCHARSGLISDVQFYESYPTDYAADVGRRARWIRGDWQIFQWLLPWVPRAGGGARDHLRYSRHPGRPGRATPLRG